MKKSLFARGEHIFDGGDYIFSVGEYIISMGEQNRIHACISKLGLNSKIKKFIYSFISFTEKPSFVSIRPQKTVLKPESDF